MLATILLIARVEFDVAITGSLVFEESQAKVATERHLVAVRLSNTKRVETNQFLAVPTISKVPFLSLITFSCFLRRDRRGKERWQKLQLNGTDRAELAASAAFESLLLLLLAGARVDKTTWPSVGDILTC